MSRGQQGASWRVGGLDYRGKHDALLVGGGGEQLARYYGASCCKLFGRRSTIWARVSGMILPASSMARPKSSRGGDGGCFGRSEGRWWHKHGCRGGCGRCYWRKRRSRRGKGLFWKGGSR
ncbi:hypothetical protein AAC387_Pa03g0086 [Persea americana]